MIKIPFLLVELALAVVWLLVRVCVWIKRRKIDKSSCGWCSFRCLGRTERCCRCCST